MAERWEIAEEPQVRVGLLARLDSNQDQLIQSQSCYRYTTGHRADLVSCVDRRTATLLHQI